MWWKETETHKENIHYQLMEKIEKSKCDYCDHQVTSQIRILRWILLWHIWGTDVILSVRIQMTQVHGHLYFIFYVIVKGATHRHVTGTGTGTGTDMFYVLWQQNRIAKGTAHRHVCFCFMLEYVRSNRYSTQAQVQVQMCFMSTNTGMSQEQEQVQVWTSFMFYVNKIE